MSPSLFRASGRFAPVGLCFTPAAPRSQAFYKGNGNVICSVYPRTDVLFMCTPDRVFGLGMGLCGRGLTVTSARDGFCVGVVCTGHRLPRVLGGFCIYPRPCVSVSAICKGRVMSSDCRWVLCDG